MTEPAAIEPNAAEGVEPASPPYVQLTQTRVPLRGARDAFSTPDEQGRYPIVAMIQQTGRFRVELFAMAFAVLVGTIALAQTPLQAILGVVVTLAIILSGSSRAIFTSIPAGTQAVMTRGGRVYGVAGPGARIRNPSILVSYLVSTREVPFWAAVRSVATKDDVRVDLQMLVTFRIEDPGKFVFNTTAADFDYVCQGASQTAIRLGMRAIDSSRLLDLANTESEEMLATIGEELGRYGVVPTRALIVRADPPAEFLATVESMKLSVLHVPEQKERIELERRAQTERASLALEQTRQQMQLEMEQVELAARVRRLKIELEADTESLRLARLEERLAKYPNATSWDWASQKLRVARSLAGNSRALVSVGGSEDVADMIMKRTMMDPEEKPFNGVPQEPTGVPVMHGPGSRAGAASDRQGAGRKAPSPATQATTEGAARRAPGTRAGG
jgi:regulator of protease activity HflC (stomatin/prohibitin superfamily)